nr:zinc finger, CCHC-type [Tanacetum cinerariifolium]
MHNMGKTIGELHAMLIEYEKGLPKKAVTPQLLAIQGDRIQKSNKKSQNGKWKGKGKGKGKDKLVYTPKPKTPKPSPKKHPAKDDASHYYKEPYIAGFIKPINFTPPPTPPPFTSTNELIHACNPINTETHHHQTPLPPNAATIVSHKVKGLAGLRVKKKKEKKKASKIIYVLLEFS